MHQKDPLEPLLRRTSLPEAPKGTCLDAETLAAWSDGSLTPAQRAAAEMHAADCDRCLAVIAAIAKTAPPPVVRQPSWFSIRWLVPLATAAVALTAWVIVREPAVPLPQSTPPAAGAFEPEPRPETAPRSTRAEGPPAPAGVGASKPSEPEAAAERQAKAQAESRRADTPLEKTMPRASPKNVAPPSPAAPAPRSARELKDERLQGQARDALAPAPVIAPPEGNVRWRITGSGVERSPDGGRTWQAQPTGTMAELVAGSAPAPSVCWIVGRGGTVLISTDGATWRRLRSPDPSADLVAVTAQDGLTATVTTADGRTYRTSDAGRTWTLQENPAAPF